MQDKAGLSLESKRYYIQSAYAIPDHAKMEQVGKLRQSGTAFRNIGEEK